MIALVKARSGPGNLELREIPEPEPEPGEVKIQVVAAGICGSDLHIAYDPEAYIGLRPPVVLGHEFSGFIHSVGRGVDGWAEGDYVTSETPVHTCGVCVYCRTGLPALCPQRRSLGSGVNGAFTNYTIAPARLLHRIPNVIEPLAAALSEPTSCCVHAVSEEGRVCAGDKVLVVGPGPIGLLVTQVAKAHGAEVTLVGVLADRERLKIGETLGADRVVFADETGISNLVSEATQGWGFDVAFECAGVQESVWYCLEGLKKRGLYVQVGVFGKPVNVDFNLIGQKEITAKGSFGTTYTAWERTLELIAQRKVHTLPLVTTDLPVTCWEEAFGLAMSKQAVKVVMRPV